VFSAAGIPIREGYGLTETSPGLTINGFAPGQALLGSVGKPLHNVEISIDTKAGDYREGEGEILAYGPNIMLGYYQRKEATDAVFTEIDGKRWFRTGDIGMFVKGPGGSDFLKITDRKKELLKTSSGKYVAPAPLESKLKEEALIEQCMVVGDARKYVAAILLPAADALRSYCKTEGITWQGLDETLKLPDVVAWYKKIVDKINADFARHEQIKQFCLVPDTWLPVHPDGTEGELTPTLKLKRRVLETKYADLIGQMYHEQKGPGKSI
jgi:long-chain acyl-CoA synthetase